ncbi:TPA: hypothetical protein I8611_001048 [Serratia marcescens]|uniref:hypothetical protein n=1 Tax=Serratia marcescens TaxID=615 RepID=UPI001A18C029|nr:hypothetical protein [Serratia marcescens]HAT3788049.1 hypothetical protein [Serratia marcescens]HAT3797855.1 hypothetical protein [Serratia marcescens]HAU5713929.1 hypothetical protein [Serratia marcescens]HAU5730050.1 hypothetical protein [Serratia marcescens]
MKTIKRFTPDYKIHAVRFEAFAREAEHGEYVRFDAHQQVVSAVEAERDALAVESIGLRHIAERIVNALHAAGYEPEENSLHPWKSLIFDAEKALETPATDAALAAIQAQGVEKAIERLMNMFASTGHIGVPVMALEDLAKELREAK